MIAFLIASAAASAQPVTLWQGVREGMTLRQLQAVRSAARVRPEGDQHWLDECTYVDDPISAGDVKLDVCYEAPHAKVEAVRLNAMMPSETSMDDFKGQLATKYGRPAVDSCDEATPRTCKTVWKIGRLTVTDTAQSLGLLNAFVVNVEYRVDGGSAASKL